MHADAVVRLHGQVNGMTTTSGSVAVTSYELKAASSALTATCLGQTQIHLLVHRSTNRRRSLCQLVVDRTEGS